MILNIAQGYFFNIWGGGVGWWGTCLSHSCLKKDGRSDVVVTLMAATLQILPWVARILAHKIALVASMVWSTRPLLLRKAYISDAHVTQMPIHFNG